MKKCRMLLVILVTLSMMLTMIGCGGSVDKQTSDETSTKAASTAAEKTSESTQADNTAVLKDPVVKFLMWENPMYVELAKEFETKYGGKVEQQVATWGSIYTKLVASISSGNSPDATFMHCAWYPSYPNKNVVQPVDGLFDKNDPIWDLNYMEKFKWMGKYYGLCTKNGFDLHIIFYNKTMFKNNGLKTPMEYYNEGQWDWENFQKVAEALTQDTDNDGTIDTYGFATCNLEDFTMSNGGQLVQYTSEGIKLTLDDPKVLKGLEYARDLRQKYKCVSTDMGIEHFVSGKCAMVSNGTWCPETNFEGFKDEWDIVPYPKAPDASEDIMVGGGWSYAIPTGAKNPEGGILLIKTLYEMQYGPNKKVDPNKKQYFTAEQQQLLDKISARTDFSRVFGIGDFGNSYWAYFDEIYNKNIPISTVNAKYTPLFQAAIDMSMKDNVMPDIIPFKGTPKADFESGDLQYFIPVADGDTDKAEVTNDANEAVEGTSAKFTSGVATGWDAIAQTDANMLELPAKHTYHIKFSYKIIAAPGKDGEFGLTIRPADGVKDVTDVKSFAGYTAITGNAGDKGDIDINIPAPGEAKDNCIVFYSNNGGTIIIDNMTITED